MSIRCLLALGALALAPGLARADDAPAAPPRQEAWAVHGQATLVEQAHPAFTAPFAGPNSLGRVAQGRETFDATLYAGVRPWRGAEIWVNGEVDQGFGLSDTLGLAGFSSAEAYKVGSQVPYAKLPRLFLRQTIGLGGESEPVDADQNQLAGARRADRLVLTIGKFAVTDVFDTNA